MKLAMGILLFSFFVHAEATGIHMPVEKNGRINNANKLSDNNGSRPGVPQKESLDDAFLREFNQHIVSIKSACEGRKTLDQKIINVREGVNGLESLLERYLPMKSELSMGNTTILFVTEEVFYYSLVFKEEITKQTIKDEQYAYSFVAYYKYLYNLGDNVRAQDFKQKWVRDMAQGLFCLDSKTNI